MSGRNFGSGEPDTDRAVFAISVAAELVGSEAQNLRLYEDRGLLKPQRTAGGTRRYSHNDIVRLRRITALLDQGLNLAGIALVLDLETENDQLRNSRWAPPRAPQCTAPGRHHVH